MPRRELEQRITTTETQINKVWYRFGLSCLGEDRAHRIYNVMHSVPAIVVETLACVEAPCIEGKWRSSHNVCDKLLRVSTLFRLAVIRQHIKETNGSRNSVTNEQVFERLT